MGQQSSALNCKADDTDNKNEVTASKEFAVRMHRNNYAEQPSDNLELGKNFEKYTEKSQPSSRTLTEPSIPQEFSCKNDSAKTIPEHESLTRVSARPFKGCKLAKKLYVESKGSCLSQIVQSRYNSTKHLPYSQIIDLTEALAYSLAHLAVKDIRHHDFYPTNVYYIDRRFKLINPLEIEATGYYLTSQRERFSFLSPELIISILEETSEQEMDSQIMYKADVFAIGMLLLEACTLQPSSECYDEQSYNIIDSVIRERISKVSSIYTPQMAELINLMLQYEVEQRPTPMLLAQIVHLKVPQQKLTAQQIQGVNQPQQVVSPRSQQMRQGVQPMRGPPAPYNHQKFRMQNVSQNSIAVTLPNEQYTRIGPNNQGFLSSSSLQQKLRVIELIKETPDEEEDEEELPTVKLTETKEQQSNQNLQQGDRKNTEEVVQTRPSYPMVESVYSDNPTLHHNPSLISSYQQQTKSSGADRPLYTEKSKGNSGFTQNLALNSPEENNLGHINKPFARLSDKQTENIPTQPNKGTYYVTSSSPYEERPNIVPPNPIQKYDYQSRYGYGFSYERPNNQQQIQSRDHQESDYSYSKQLRTATDDTLPDDKNYHTSDRAELSACSSPYQYLAPSKSAHNLGQYFSKPQSHFSSSRQQTQSKQGETLEERVQRILNMSKQVR